MASVCGCELLYMRDALDGEGRAIGVEGDLFVGTTMVGPIRVTAHSPYDWVRAAARWATEYPDGLECTYGFPASARRALDDAIGNPCAAANPAAPRDLRELCEALAVETVQERHERYMWLCDHERRGAMPSRALHDDLAFACPEEVVRYRDEIIDREGLMPEAPNDDDLEWLNGTVDPIELDVTAICLESVGVDLESMIGRAILNRSLLFERVVMPDGQTAAEALRARRPELREWADVRYTRLVPTGPCDGPTAEMFDVNTGSTVRVGTIFTMHESWETGSVGCFPVKQRDGVLYDLGPALHDNAMYVYEGRPSDILSDVRIALATAVAIATPSIDDARGSEERS